MATEKVKANRFSCDGCSWSALVEAGGDEPFGYYGTVQHIHEGGGSASAPWFAHADECVLKAIETALKRAWQ